MKSLHGERLLLASPERRPEKRLVKNLRILISSLDPTSAVNVATNIREAGGTDDCTLAHSINSFLFNALMSCLMEKSRTGSGVMVAMVDSPWEYVAPPGNSSCTIWSHIHCPSENLDTTATSRTYLICKEVHMRACLKILK